MAAAGCGDGLADVAKADAAPEGAAAAALAGVPTPARSLPPAERGRPGASAARGGLWRIYSATVLPQGGAPQDGGTSPRQSRRWQTSAECSARRAADAAVPTARPAPPRAPLPRWAHPSRRGPAAWPGPTTGDATPQSAASIAPFAVARASTEAPEVTRARQRAARAKENAAKAAAQRNAAAAAGGAAATGATPVGEIETKQAAARGQRPTARRPRAPGAGSRARLRQDSSR
ncbi:unnamed protein product [Prorocentrum cordatum]|uniref:Uncharacterized protein n=1 Tax=Prorocentrum cordatum TaxID=2364126 RepID=A0ABN9X5W9_9DINO|nr:unnamed protein product [Polarella glacialis]